MSSLSSNFGNGSVRVNGSAPTTVLPPTTQIAVGAEEVEEMKFMVVLAGQARVRVAVGDGAADAVSSDEPMFRGDGAHVVDSRRLQQPRLALPKGQCSIRTLR